MALFDISEVLAKAPLEDVARRLGIETEKRGNQLSALCPFHQDTRPSLRFFPPNNGSSEHFHCFACGAHGHAIDLVKKVQGVEFLPAVQWLAQSFGVKIPRRVSTNQREHKNTTTEAQTFALRVFEKYHDAPRFKAWCKERAFNDDLLYRQGVRCISRAAIVQELEAKNTAERIELIDGLLDLGLVKRLKPKPNANQLKLTLPDQFQDYFHDGRILIPIYSANEKNPELVGFAGRSLQEKPPEGVAKYLLNEGFPKAKYLFNASNAFAAASNELKSDNSTTLYLVEGFLDALRLQGLGLNAVALMGTSLSNEQFDLLKDFVESLPNSKAELQLSIFLDNDKAGFTGADKLARRLLGMVGINLRWIGLDTYSNLPIGKDPDTCLKTFPTRNDATTWLENFNRPAEAVLLVSEMGDIAPSNLRNDHWSLLNPSARERVVFKTAVTIRQVRGSRPLNSFIQRLEIESEDWATALCELLKTPKGTQQHRSSELFLQGLEGRLSHARALAYHGSRRGELPCDEEAWLTLDVSARLFDRIAEQRLTYKSWVQASPYDAVHLPRKLTANTIELEDPRRKVMPHPADLHLQQILLNELLTQRHDLLSAENRTFSAWIPAVRWFSSSQKVEVTGPFDELTALEGEEPILSFGYQVDMDVLEGAKTPSDQGMFRAYGQCWRDFMSSLNRQCQSIGSRVHVLRLDAKRYYDSIQRYVVRDALREPIQNALNGTGVSFFGPLLGLVNTGSPEEVAEVLVDRICDFLFGHYYRHPDTGVNDQSMEAIGIPQGPVLSAYIGTIALFPVDLAARKFMRRTTRLGAADDMGLPRIGYARYVDDIVIFADSEELLSELRDELQAEAGKLSIALINKGDRVRSGTPEEVIHQLNEGRGLAASVPAWEPPFIGDGETGWGLGGDMPEVDRQCALRMLRHPVLMDQPKLIQEHIRQAMQAPDLRPNDLALCSRWLWWQVATELPAETRQTGPDNIWASYWQLWHQACDGHIWAMEFDRRGYSQLYAVEGLDRLLDFNPWMENDQTHSEVPQQREIRIRLAKQVLSEGFFRDVRPTENSIHVRRRVLLVVAKARGLVNKPEAQASISHQGTSAVTSIEWLCMAAELIRRYSTDDAHANTPLASIKIRSIHGPQETVSFQVCEVLRHADTLGVRPPYTLLDTKQNYVAELALSLVIENTTPKERLRVLTKFPRLMEINNNGVTLSLIQQLPIAEATSLWALGMQQDGAQNLYRFSLSAEAPAPVVSQDLVCIKFASDGLPIASLKTLSFEPSKLNHQLTREKSLDHVSWTLDLESSPALRRTDLAVCLFKAVVAMQRVSTDDVDLTHVPFAPQIFKSNDTGQPTLYLVAEPVKRNALGVSAWYRDIDGRVRTVSVPLADAELWRAGWTVADALGMAIDMAGETGLRDEQLPEKAATLIEDYLLRQQLRKLQGAYLSEAQTLRRDAAGLPYTVLRALQLLSEFDGHAPLDQQVQQLLVMEAETQSMALRLKKYGGSGLRPLLHLVFPAVLNKLPLWAIEHLKLLPPCSEHKPLRPDLALMLSLYEAMENYWARRTETHHRAATTTLHAALALATAGAGLRGSVAALWGLTQAQGSRRMPERLDMPAAWPMPDMIRTDPQSDYSAIRQWLNDGDWPALCRASPWHWMLALIGLFNANFPQAFKQPQLQQIFITLTTWQSQENDESAALVWPYDGLPILEQQQWTALLAALPKAIHWLDVELGMYVAHKSAPRYRRNPHTDEFTDANNQDWLLCKPQFTGLGSSDRIARHIDGSRILNVWTETRRVADDCLLAVHSLDRKLGAWLKGVDLSDADSSTATSTATSLAKPISQSDTHAEEISHIDATELAPNFTQDLIEESTTTPAAKLDNDTPAEKNKTTDRLLETLRYSQGTSRKNRGKHKADAHFRVALFQWHIEDTYAHPLGEVGLPMSKKSNAEFCELLDPTSPLSSVSKAAKRGEEHRWTDNAKVISLHEHRRRTLLRQALNACKDLGVQLLVLPEVSVRKDTVEWLENELRNFEGLAVLAGTYRHFSDRSDDSEHLRAPLTLLWKPESKLSEQLGLGSVSKTFVFERGKKYRAVAANELFRPHWDRLAPLYTEEKLIQEVMKELRQPGQTPPRLDQLSALVHAIVHLSPPLRYCMELICSELFLLTSPANFEPLRQEVVKLLSQFPSNSEDSKELVQQDFAAIGELLTFAQKDRERRSVLLVPAFTSRSNDYWHTGQANVLASGTVTVFCNAAHQGSAGGSCFIGINSVSHTKETAGIVSCLTPYHGWQKGILQTNSDGALSKNDEALVVVDIDPVHAVSGKPRPQLLPEPISLVAYLPVVNLINAQENADGMVHALQTQLQNDNQDKAKDLFLKKEFLANFPRHHDRNEFYTAYQNLLNAKNAGSLQANGAEAFDNFVNYFSDPDAMRKRFLAWKNDRHQQPGSVAGGDRLEPAWLDFLVADLTCTGILPEVRVPPWIAD